MKTNKLIIGILGVALLTTSCRKGCTDPEAENYDAKAKKNDNSCTYAVNNPTTSELELHMHHLIDTLPFAFNTDFEDDFGNTYQFTRAQLYMSNPVFLDDNMDTIASLASYLLVDPETEEFAIGELDGDTHVHMMSIGVGVDATANASDPATYASTHALAYQTPSMHWNWSSGYIFIVLEGVVDIDDNGTYDSGETFIFHVGMNGNYVYNQGLMAHFNTVAGIESTIHLELDWGMLLDNIDLSIDNSTHTMDDMALASRVSSNAASILSVE